MKIMKRQVTICCAAVLAAFSFSLPAQNYPSRPVRVIVPFPAGSGTDIIGRIVGQKMGESLKQQFVVDNRAGAGAMMGMELAAHSTPDGYSVILVTSSYTINAAIYPKLPYDSLKDFVPVSQLASTPYLLIVPPSFAAKSVADLIVLAKAKPGQLSYGSGGVGTASHLAGELFKVMAAVNIVHVPYRGMPQVNTDIAGGQVQVAFSTLPAALPLVKGGRLRALAVTSARPFAAVGDLPTVAQAGVPGFEVTTWQGMLAPARTPAAAIDVLQKELVQALKLPAVRDRLATDGFVVVANRPEEFAAVIRAEIEKWMRVAKAAAINPLEKN
jgi:tripartite-type tricarboxylate transporter receptor subunit TctC